MAHGLLQRLNILIWRRIHVTFQRFSEPNSKSPRIKSLHEKPESRQKWISIFIMTALSSQAFAAEPQPSITDLQNENLRQREEILELKRQLQQLGQPPGTSAPTPAVARENATDKSTDTRLGAVVIRGRQKPPLETLKDEPKSISVVSGAELEKLDTSSFRDIVTRVGNISMSYTNPQAGSLFIRGVGWASGVGVLDPSVGLNVDGVSYGATAIGTSTNFIDIDTFDVARGPQGTRGGKNSSVGQITIKTKSPSFEPEASGSIRYGENNSISTKAVIGGAVIPDLLAWRGTFYREQSDGEFENRNDRNYSYRNTDRTYGRTQFLLTPSDDFTARVSLEFTPKIREVSDNYVFFNRPTPNFYDSLDPGGNPIAVNQSLENAGRLQRRWFAQEPSYTVNGDYLGNEINRLSQNTNSYSTKGASINLAWNIGRHALSSITALNDFDFDSGGGPISVFDIDRSPSTGHVEYKQYSQEFKLVSQSDGRLNYETGVYLFKNDIPERWTTARHGSDAGAFYANTTQYNLLDRDGNGRNLLLNSIDRLFTKTRDDISNTSTAIFANLDFRVSDPLTINAGLRLTREIRNTRSERSIVDQGFGAELNPQSVNDVWLGGFNNAANGNLTTNTAEQLALADSVAQKYFNRASYAALTSDEKQQVAYAKAIRASRLGGLYQDTEAETFDKVLPTYNISPSYKFNDNQTGYLSYQHGEKAGISQIVGASAAGGNSAPVKQEKTDTYEIGLKSALLDHTLIINSDVFWSDIRDYIQPMYFEDRAQTLINNDGKIAYTSGLGNVPKVQVNGVELDAVYSGIQYTTLRFAGAYNDARYKDFRQLAKPLELGGTSTPYYDASGKTLPGAAKFTFNITADYSRPVFDTRIFHTTINYRYTSRYNNDLSLSRYAEVDPYGIADLAIGIGTRDKFFDASLIVKNLFDTDHGFYSNWNTYYPSQSRWIGVMLSGKL